MVGKQLNLTIYLFLVHELGLQDTSVTTTTTVKCFIAFVGKNLLRQPRLVLIEISRIGMMACEGERLGACT